MLKGIKGIMNTMGEALTFADAGEMLTAEQKTEMLARHQSRFQIAPDALLPRVVLAGDEELAPASVERAIAMCRENNAMLDLLYVSPEGSRAIKQLATVLPRLQAEPGLDFQVTRRQGDLLVVTENYLRARKDTLMILISVSEHLRSRAERYRRTEKWSRTSRLPAVELIGDVILA